MTATPRTAVVLGIVGALLCGCMEGSSDTSTGSYPGVASSPVPQIKVEPADLDFGDVLVGTSRTLSATVTNTGTAQLDVNAVSLDTATDEDFAILSGPEAVSLAPEASMEIQVVYEPQELKTHSGKLHVKSNARGDSDVTFRITGKGVPKPSPEIDVAPRSLAFSDVFIGASASLTVTVRNIGTASLEVGSVRFGAGTSTDFRLGSPAPPTSVAPGASFSLTVTYAPAVSGGAEGNLVVESNDANESLVTIPLSGNGVPAPAPQVEVTPRSLDFGEVLLGSVSRRTFTVKNTGSAPLSILAIELGPGTTEAFGIASDPGTASLAPDSSITVEVTYAPTELTSDSRTVRVQTDDADEAAVTVSLSGTGVPVPVPEVDVTPLALDFGEVLAGSSASLRFTIKNSGTANLAISHLELAAGSPAVFSLVSGAGAATVAPGSSLSVVVRFAPQDVLSSSGTVRVETNDADEALVQVSLAGTGAPVPVPEIAVTPASLDFGEVLVGSSRSLVLSVRNTGTAALEISRIGLGAATGGEFAITSGSAGSLAAGAETSITVRYMPVDLLADSGTVVLESNDADEGTVAVSLSGWGVPAPVGRVEVSPLALDFGDVSTEGSASLDLTIQNTGTASLYVSRVALTAGGSSEFSVSSSFSGSSVAAGGRLPVTLTYTPVDAGLDQAAVLIESDDPDQPQVSVTLSGTGLVPNPGGDPRPVTLSWDAPTTNADGTPLTDLAGFKVYWGTSPGSYTFEADAGPNTTHTIPSVAPATYYFAVTAYDTSGNESGFSEEVSAVIE